MAVHPTAFRLVHVWKGPIIAQTYMPMRYKLKSILQRSSSFQNAYSWFLYHRAKARFRQKRYYESLDLVCTALRRVSDPRATDAHWRLLRRIKDTACLPGVGENPGENLLMKSFLASKEAEDIRADFQKEPLEDRIRLRRHRDEHEVLPWSHLTAGLHPDFLWGDWQDALAESGIEDCRWTPCYDCGVCTGYGIEHVVASPTAPAGGSQGTGQDLSRGHEIPVELLASRNVPVGAPR